MHFILPCISFSNFGHVDNIVEVYDLCLLLIKHIQFMWCTRQRCGRCGRSDMMERMRFELHVYQREDRHIAPQPDSQTSTSAAGKWLLFPSKCTQQS